ncbi:SDR family NAD(P)-dependent oxidoreductase [Nocardiopsis alba]|uniref:SDR family NAD(P)-dependent oxidoreductase n=1 Tax=Nocardiopsis alba TaxID=53437 RepID=UPI00339EEDC6
MNRSVLITGAAKGLGRAIALAFAQLGDRVAVHYGSSRSEAEELLRLLPGDGHTLIEADLRDPDAPPALVSTAVERLGGVDVLVNNAAVNLPHPVADTSFEEWSRVWRETVDVNVLGAAHLSHQAARDMIERGVRGRIVNIGSRGAFKGEPDHPAYGASKAALHSLGQSLAVSLAPHGIAVASIAPGFIATERVAHRITDEVLSQSPFGRVATPEEIAAAVIHLASPEAEWASGSVLDLNGASYLH